MWTVCIFSTFYISVWWWEILCLCLYQSTTGSQNEKICDWRPAGPTIYNKVKDAMTLWATYFLLLRLSQYYIELFLSGRTSLSTHQEINYQNQGDIFQINQGWGIFSIFLQMKRASLYGTHSLYRYKTAFMKLSLPAIATTI